MINIRESFVWRFVQSYKQKINSFFFKEKFVTHNYSGEILKVSIKDGLADGWYNRDWPMLSEIRLLRQGLLKSGSLVFDLGGHQGVVAMILAKNVGQNGRVIVAEPNPHNYQQIKTNIELNGFQNITAIKTAIGDKKGSLSFSSALNGTPISVGKYGLTQIVPMTTIDHLVKEFGHPNVVFVDIEGFEELALSAAKSAFSGNCDFFVEVHVKGGLEASGGSVSGVLDYFPAGQFERFVHHDDGKEPIRIEDAPEGFFDERFFLTALAK